MSNVEFKINLSATGVPNLIRADMVKPGATIIDVGITRVTDEVTGKTKLVGDVDFENVKKIAGKITPVPGKTQKALKAKGVAAK